VFLSNYALLNLYDSLARVKGVGQVRIFGARDYSMRIWLDPEKMAHRGVTAIDVSNIVREQNVIAPAGSIGLPPVPSGQQLQYNRLRQGAPRRDHRVREHRHPRVRQWPGRSAEGRGAGRARRADYSLTVAEDDDRRWRSHLPASPMPTPSTPRRRSSR